MNEPHLSGTQRLSTPPTPMPRPAVPLASPKPAAPSAPKPIPVDDTISLVDDLSDASEAIAQFRATIKEQTTERQFKRIPHNSGAGAVRVRSFHGRLSDEGMQRFDDRVNDWLDSHPQIEVKFATTTIATWDGKTKEPAIVVNIWY